ncbi:MAG: FAD:protein FMN transferase [Bacteroidetes bacterium]|nr:FAD:protein FMN transferase [Bacteroidota bacterium]
MPEVTDHATQIKAYKRGMRLMGNHFEITVVASVEDFANYCIDQAVLEISRIEKLLTTFNDQSQTAAINRHAGIKPVKVDQEVFDLIARSKRISALTQGAFDLSYGSIDKTFWNFDTAMDRLPDRVAAKDAVRLINYRNIVLNEQEGTVFLKEKGMRIGFGGIGKGYAAERAKSILMALGINSGIVNASGDLAAWGQQPDGNDWTVGVADPDHCDQPFSYLNISNLAIATSGNYEKFVTIGGKRYSHTIDPRTGFPVQGIKSVSIICPNAEIADALATPVMVMGVSAGMNLINQMKGVACIVIDDNDRLYTSNNIKLSQ